MHIHVSATERELGIEAARIGGKAIAEAIEKRGSASIVIATGASQFEMLKSLTRNPAIDWSRVTVFHLDEYVGLPESHRASFRRYIRERFLNLIGPTEFVPVLGDAVDPQAEVERLNTLINGRLIDVCFAGIGENCHLAFNDPPADFETDIPFLIVSLDPACRRQQFNEGWFPLVDDVPERAISMSIRQILKAESLVVAVPGARKAEAVKNAVEAEISPNHPASILRTHPNCTLLLDTESADRLAHKPLIDSVRIGRKRAATKETDAPVRASPHRSGKAHSEIYRGMFLASVYRWEPRHCRALER